MRVYLVLSVAIFLAFSSEAIKSKKLKKFISGHKISKGSKKCATNPCGGGSLPPYWPPPCPTPPSAPPPPPTPNYINQEKQVKQKKKHPQIKN